MLSRFARTSSEIKKSRVFDPAMFYRFLRAFQGLSKHRMKIITFTTNCLKQHF